MKLTVVRKYKKQSYVIGELWIDGKKVCDTLEPTDRGLVNEAKPDQLTSDEWIKAKNAVFRAKQVFPRGTIAIPTGLYRVGVNISSKFKARRLYLRNVPGFEGIMIHEGNSSKDTEGCILVGKNSIKGRVQESKFWLKKVNDLVMDVIRRNETVIIKITDKG